MTNATIFRIRCTLAVRGMTAAVALFRAACPEGTPAHFCAYILGKRAQVRL